MDNKAMKVLYDVYICCSNIYGNRLSDVYLYGSYALGDYDNESDVDILVTANIDTPEHGDYFNKIYNSLLFHISNDDKIFPGFIKKLRNEQNC